MTLPELGVEGGWEIQSFKAPLGRWELGHDRKPETEN